MRSPEPSPPASGPSRAGTSEGSPAGAIEPPPGAPDAASGAPDAETLRARIAELEAEVHRLRTERSAELVRAQRRAYLADYLEVHHIDPDRLVASRLVRWPARLRSILHRVRSRLPR